MVKVLYSFPLPEYFIVQVEKKEYKIQSVKPQDLIDEAAKRLLNIKEIIWLSDEIYTEEINNCIDKELKNFDKE